jgi:hypothetical protein
MPRGCHPGDRERVRALILASIDRAATVWLSIAWKNSLCQKPLIAAVCFGLSIMPNLDDTNLYSRALGAVNMDIHFATSQPRRTKMHDKRTLS